MDDWPNNRQMRTTGSLVSSTGSKTATNLPGVRIPRYELAWDVTQAKGYTPFARTASKCHKYSVPVPITGEIIMTKKLRRYKTKQKLHQTSIRLFIYKKHYWRQRHWRRYISYFTDYNKRSRIKAPTIHKDELKTYSFLLKLKMDLYLNWSSTE